MLAAVATSRFLEDGAKGAERSAATDGRARRPGLQVPQRRALLDCARHGRLPRRYHPRTPARPSSPIGSLAGCVNRARVGTGSGRSAEHRQPGRDDYPAGVRRRAAGGGRGRSGAGCQGQRALWLRCEDRRDGGRAERHRPRRGCRRIRALCNDDRGRAVLLVGRASDDRSSLFCRMRGAATSLRAALGW